MNKICTDLKQSKKLVELGLDPNTADMMYLYWINSETKQEGIEDIPIVREELPIQKGDVPAWSLTALLKLMPSRIDGSYTKLTKLHEYGWYIEGHQKVGEPVDVAFEMVCWLLDNGYIKKV